MTERFVGIDVGAETVKLVELERQAGALRWTRRALAEHHKNPGATLLAHLQGWGWPGVRGAAVSGRLGRQVLLPRIPTKQAQAAAYRFLHSDSSATIVSIGSHGFSVLELRPAGNEIFRENSRCSQGTGNFLRQLVERFDLSIEEASELCAGVDDPAPLSGRCPVILKTDMTHLANKGESRARILAGLYDAVCENVQVLIKPRLSPPKVVMIGGVSRSRRIRENFRRFLFKHAMALVPTEQDDALFFEALGCALLAAEHPGPLPALERLLAPPLSSHLEEVPPLAACLSKVKRMPRQGPAAPATPRPVVLGFDIGSTGSKAVAVDAGSREVLWEGYTATSGDPVGAAQKLMRQFVAGPVGGFPVTAVGATGSGREIVGSLMTTCYGSEAVYVLNEIAAHAEGALHYDQRVDTIFEIGGQDAKYIRLAEGRVVDAAMNEACSAGTGSFIEEQGKKFAGIDSVVQLGEEALRASCGVSLGQHCSVFMAEIIDEAVAAGSEPASIIAGIYDSIIQNYLNRVKGCRSVGQVVFCQGMPFSADALAAAVARQTGSEVIVPPSPGTVGALGIALLALKEISDAASRPALDPDRFLSARLEKKDTFVCRSTQGCGGGGNRCRIDRLSTVVAGERQRFTWGGGCSLYDKGTRRRKLPDRAPDPFREREELMAQVVARFGVPPGSPPLGPRVALTDEFLLKGLFPFFASFIHELGFEVQVTSGADQKVLKRGIEEANVPFCAPMQLYHGLVSTMAESRPDLIFLPMLREIPRVGDEPASRLCPIVQGSPDMLRLDLGAGLSSRIVSPVIDVGRDLESGEFVESCRRLAAELGVTGEGWREPYRRALALQTRFDARLLELGRRALAYCAERDIVPVVVLGRTYTIYNKVLNSNVPAILREQGAIAIPVDCYPVDDDVPVFSDVYWGYAQRNLRAAHQVRRRPDVYSLFCSNYACGPDSFSIHFYGYIMEGKPFAIIETDGHSGDAGTKTRVEAFLHCVHEDRARQGGARQRRLNSIKLIELDTETLGDIMRRGERVLVPRMGVGAEALAACFRGLGIAAEALPLPDRETVRIGRRHTSGKECVPMCITLGSLLQRIEKDRDSDERFSLFMPTAKGPCRFGMYQWLHKITLERLGWKDRVRVWSPSDSNYFDKIPPGFAAVVFTGFMGVDLLLEALYDVRPVERRPGAAQAVYQRYHAELLELLREAAAGDLSVPHALYQVGSGKLFGVSALLQRAGRELRALRDDERQLPTVLVVGEIYVRCDPFANDFIIDKLEERGVRCRFAPFNEWLEYTDLLAHRKGERPGVLGQATSLVQAAIQNQAYWAMGRELGWPPRTSVRRSLQAARDYLREELHGEAVLTVGGPVQEWREGIIDGVVSVGPLECMPNKIAEAQFFHVAEREGLPSLTLALNGDPVDPEIVDNFVFAVKAGLEARRTRAQSEPALLARSRRLLAGLGWAPATSRPLVLEVPAGGGNGNTGVESLALAQMRGAAGRAAEAEER